MSRTDELRYVPDGIPEKSMVGRVRAEVFPGSFPGSVLARQRRVVEAMLSFRAAAIRDGMPLQEAWDYHQEVHWIDDPAPGMGERESESVAAAWARMKRCFLLPWEPR
jgi:hypothetical protein